MNGLITLYISGFFTGHDPNPRVDQKLVEILWVGSGRVGSGRIGPGQEVFKL